MNPFKSKKGLGRGLSSLIGDVNSKPLNNKISINAAQELIVVGSQKISKSSRGLLLKSAVINAMATNPASATLIAAFVPSGFGARIRPGER